MHTHAYTHTYIGAPTSSNLIHTCQYRVHTQVNTHSHTHRHTYTLTHNKAHTHTCIISVATSSNLNHTFLSRDTYMYIHTHINTCTYAHSHSHTFTQTRTNANMHAHMHTHTHTHSQENTTYTITSGHCGILHFQFSLVIGCLPLNIKHEWDVAVCWAVVIVVFSLVPFNVCVCRQWYELISSVMAGITVSARYIIQPCVISASVRIRCCRTLDPWKQIIFCWLTFRFN